MKQAALLFDILRQLQAFLPLLKLMSPTMAPTEVLFELPTVSTERSTSYEQIIYKKVQNLCRLPYEFASSFHEPYYMKLPRMATACIGLFFSM